jgi:glycine betaine/proline transport system substrate-binding protein
MNKELDLYIEAWLPLTHETYWDRVSSSVCDFGPMYEDASLGWAVPNYIPKDVLNSVEDMDKEEVKKKCGGRIVGIDPGSGLMQHSALMMKQYPELEGWKLVEGSDAAMSAELKRSMQRKEWLIVTLWRPHHAFARFDIRYIEEPKKILGYEERSHMLGREDFMSVFPNKVSRFCTRFTMPIDVVDDITNMYQDNEKTAAPKFVKKYPELVNYWLNGIGE